MNYYHTHNTVVCMCVHVCVYTQDVASCTKPTHVNIVPTMLHLYMNSGTCKYCSGACNTCNTVQDPTNGPAESVVVCVCFAGSGELTIL